MQQKQFFVLNLLVAVTLISLYSCKKNEVPAPIPEPNTITYDGFTYRTVTIPGAGTWTVENARNTHFSNGDPIRNAKTNEEWKDETNKKIAAKTSDTGAWCYYKNTNSADTQNIYGKLYNFYAVKDARGLAPKGWHVATDAEFINLVNILGDSAGQKLKSNLYWIIDVCMAKPSRNITGFAAVPAGYRYDSDGDFHNLGTTAYFWSSTEDSDNAWWQYLDYNDAGTYRNSSSKLLGLSVRFVKD